jgi:hypothetical protein
VRGRGRIGNRLDGRQLPEGLIDDGAHER